MAFEISVSPHFLPWLHDARISLAFSTYQTNRLFLIGLKPDGTLSTFERLFDRPMGLCADGDGLLMATRWQIWELKNALPPGATHDGYDKLYVPRRAHTTGELDAHDIARDASGRIVFVNTMYSCLAAPDDTHSFAPLWQPPFVTDLVAEDRCHLNGMALRDGAPRYVTAVSRSDMASGWRDRRANGGVLVDVTSNEIVLSGLSMPHSPRWHNGKVWLQNAGTGELGYADEASGAFVPVAFCPGFMRGMSFHGNFAIIGLSKPRHQRNFTGLALDAALRGKDVEAMCGLWVVDIRTGKTAHWLKLEETVDELYDVVVLPETRQPMALGFQSDEIRRLISIRKPDGVVFDPLGSEALSADDGNAAKLSGQIALDAPPARAPSPTKPVVATPADEYYRAANRLVRLANYHDAIPLYQQALRVQPSHLNAWLNLGSCCWQVGHLDEALACYRRVLELDPREIRALSNLAKVLRAQGRVSEAITHYTTALQTAPDDVELLNQTGLAYYEDGRLDRAEALFKRVMTLDPNNAEAHNNLAGIFKLNEDLDEALRLHKRAAELKPNYFVALENIGKIYEDRHQTADAKKAYARALRAQDEPLLELHATLLCPPIFASAAAMDAYRVQAEATLDAWRGREIKIALEQAQSSRAEPPFDWAYHGRDNRALKQKYASLFKLVGADGYSAAPKKSSTGQISVCFVVTPTHEGVFMRCMRGIINQMDPARFAVTLACSRAGEGVLRQGITCADVRYLRMPLRFDQMAAQLQAGGFDVLYYWEVGTDSSNFFLPFLRLAPAQVTGWGWPDTSGAPQLDFHITSEALAAPNSDEAYTEKLARLPHLPAYFYPSPIPQTPDRAWLNSVSRDRLPQNSHVYVCAQNLRKIHPDMDEMIGGVLRGDPRGVFVCVGDPQPVMGELLRARWQTTLPDVAERMIMVPRLKPEDYFAVIASADVILDTPHFSGSNTSYDAFSAGVPVVTLPGAFPRGRYTAALYAQMNFGDCIAESTQDYVDIALELGEDKAYREQISKEIRANTPAIFERRDAVTQLERFFEQVAG